MHDVFGNLFHPGVAEESAASSAKAIERMEAFSGRWLNQPDLQGVLRSIAILMTKQMMMKELVTGLDFGLSTTSAVLDLLDDLAPVVLDLITSGEVIFFSDMSSISLSMPVKLCYHVSACRMLLTPDAPSLVAPRHDQDAGHSAVTVDRSRQPTPLDYRRPPTSIRRALLSTNPECS